MTTLYGIRSTSVTIFDTNDDYPFVTERTDSLPFHMFRSAEIDSDPQVLLSILVFAINTISEMDGASYKTDHTDIIGHQCKQVEFRGHKISLFEQDDSLIAISTLSKPRKVENE